MAFSRPPPRLFCSPPAAVVWTKPGATSQDFNVDSYQCEKDARQSGYFGTGLVGAINFNEFEVRCMRAHGWTATRVSTSANDNSPKINDDPDITCQLSDSAPMVMSRSSCLERHGTATY